MTAVPVPWEVAWGEALYGPDGFYRREVGPAGHFTTSAHGPLGAAFASALLTLAAREGLGTIVDFGAGRGELLGHLHAAAAAGAGAGAGADSPTPPAGPTPPDDIGWTVTAGGGAVTDLRRLDPALVVANEWLDVLPCPIVEVDRFGTTRYIHVEPDGSESLGDPVRGADAEWLASWWPTSASGPGQRAEVGLPRDRAYAALLALRATGRVRAVGVSNFAIPHLERVHAELGEYPAINQIELHPYLQQRQLRAFHREHDGLPGSGSPAQAGRRPASIRT